EYVDDAVEFLRRGITPVVRLYRDRFGAGAFDRAMRDETLAFLRAGVQWFEFYNEPNLGIEWPPGVDIDWRNQDLIRPLVDNWLTWAEFIISQGGYPGFIPLAESDDPKAAAVRWMDAFLNDLRQRHYDRFRTVLANGAYCATHPYILNHFYQEVPGEGPTSARPLGAQVAREPGWHFEYPYDPLQQSIDPGRTVFGGTALTPNGDPVGLTAMGRMFNERCAQWFGTQAVPVVGTEGGIFPFLPDDHGRLYQQDNRYPPYDEVSQAQATIAMFDWIARQGPPWLFGVCLWKEDVYYNPDKTLAILRMEETEPYFKSVPPLEVMANPLVEEDTIVPGPGPIHGQADFHMIIFGPGVDTSWFFETARPYWELFRPIVTTDLSLMDRFMSDKSLAATVICPPEYIATLTERIKDRYPHVWFDLIVAEKRQDVGDILNERVERNQRF
ncbi:MAG: hypothetical protein K8J31_10235, partial [Anaerolineae bacterium]|nr:hypothetical protein [Anaerolineae bacterium]